MNTSRHQSSNGAGIGKGHAYTMPEIQSPGITWSPFFENMQGDDYMSSKGMEISTFTAFESLQMDDLLNHDAGSSTSSAASEVGGNPTSSLHHLPAWSTCEEDERFGKSSPADSDNVEENNDIWFAPTVNLSKKKRLPSGRQMMAEEREVSPGATSANLKSHKSAPQLVRRITSSDHKAKLEDLLVEMGWPRDASTSNDEATDGGENQGHSSGSNGGGGSSSGISQSTSSGAGSLASGMPPTSALFERRAHMREGNMPAPQPVVVPHTEEMNKGPATCVPTFDMDQHIRPDVQLLQHSRLQPSRSATFPLNHQQADNALLYGPSSGPAAYTTLYNNFVNPSQPYVGQDNSERAAKAIEAAFLYGMEPRRGSIIQQQSSRDPLRIPDTPSTGSTGTELRTPVTPFQALTTTDVSSVSFDYQGASATDLSSQLLSGSYQSPYLSKMKSQQNLSNSLGLQDMQTMNPNQQYQPTMIDSSAYAQIFSNMPSTTMFSSASDPFVQQDQQDQRQTAEAQRHYNLKQTKSSPNMRVSPSSEGSSSPTKPSIRKIASNRRLTVSYANDNNFSVMQSPIKSPNRRGKSHSTSIPLPPMPTTPSIYLPQLSTSNSNNSGGGSSSFQFVNYGVEDADELCSAVAPSGSYKIPLKGFGSSQDGEDDGEEGDDDEDEERPKTSTRVRSKSNAHRFGPRWQGLSDDDEEGGSNSLSEEKKSRQIKRRKSEACMTTLSGKRKTASSGNLRRG